MTENSDYVQDLAQFSNNACKMLKKKAYPGRKDCCTASMPFFSKASS